MRRPVRVDDHFLELLDTQLGAERKPSGEPSTTDFLLIELPPISELFATSFDRLMVTIPGRPDYRSVLTVGATIPRILVTGHLGSNGYVVLLSVQLDFDAGW
ncbi:MAG: hypothetical protein ISR43_01155 [Acidimicrobiia bacterium]|nr:hypothetical protein [Actinomycetota bacterium]MBL6925149.1 hypothetical protein [Acidimicrobiia bacterium]MBL6925820.1 hypothetical protein [Acidimicrobiia bacterium]